MEKRIKIGRHEENITLNLLEWLLDVDGKLLTFEDVESAKKYLIGEGMGNFEGIYFEFVEDGE